MSVGHLARSFEEMGLSTVIIAAEPFRGRLEAMALPRVLITPHPMGRVFGPPNDAARQREALDAGLALLETAQTGGTLATLPGTYFGLK